MFILTDGKNYVMENPMKTGDFISTTSPVQAKEFSYKQANSLRQRRGKKYSWVHNFQMVNVDTGEKSNISPNYKGNANAYIGENDIKFDETVLDKIADETHLILGLAAWNKEQLDTYKNDLCIGLSKTDSVISDITHAFERYVEDNDGKRPPAHKISKVTYKLIDILVLRRRIKQCIDYVSVMRDAITYKYDISKIKSEVEKAKHSEYKARTEEYETILNILMG